MHPQCHPFAIYAGTTPVGFLMLRVDYLDRPLLWRRLAGCAGPVEGRLTGPDLVGGHDALVLGAVWFVQVAAERASAGRPPLSTDWLSAAAEAATKASCSSWVAVV
jgi:hypothetical protein